jgi:hypothetical protein
MGVGYAWDGWGDVAPSPTVHSTPYPPVSVQVVLPTPHRRSQAPATLGNLARLTWRRPSGRDLVFAPLPFARVFVAWLGIAVAIRLTEAMREGILIPLFGSIAGEVIGAVLSIACVLTITLPFFRVYTGQYAGTLVWYGIVLATLTVLFETVFAHYVQHRFGYEILERYNLMRGHMWSLVVVTIAVTPLLWTRWAESSR